MVRQRAEKIKTSKINLEGIRRDLRKRYRQHPSLYTAGLIIGLLVFAVILIFLFNRNMFLAGSINGRLVTTPEFYKELVKQNGEEIFDSIVRETLIKQEAGKKDLTASKEEVGEKVKELEGRFGGKEALKSLLAQNNTNLTEVREQLELQILIEKLLDQKISVSEEEVAKYVKENKDAASGLTKEQVKDQLRSQKLNEEFTKWFEDVKEKAKINKYF